MYAGGSPPMISAECLICSSAWSRISCRICAEADGWSTALAALNRKKTSRWSRRFSTNFRNYPGWNLVKSDRSRIIWTEPLLRFFRRTDKSAAPLLNRFSGRPLNRVVKFDDFLLAGGQIQVPGDLPAILVDTGRFDGVLPRYHGNIIILGDRNLVVNR